MGILLSYLGYSADSGMTDDPDPVTGLTSKDKYLIRTSWEVVMRDPTKNGMELFLKLFEINSGYQQRFPFKNVPTNQLKENRVFQAHCNTVMYAFASIVSTLDQPDLLISVNEKIGISHSKRGIDEQALIDVKNATLSILSFLSEEHITAWNQLLDVGFKHMLEAIIETNQNPSIY